MIGIAAAGAGPGGFRDALAVGRVKRRATNCGDIRIGRRVVDRVLHDRLFDRLAILVLAGVLLIMLAVIGTIVAGSGEHGDALSGSLLEDVVLGLHLPNAGVLFAQTPANRHHVSLVIGDDLVEHLSKSRELG